MEEKREIVIDPNEKVLAVCTFATKSYLFAFLQCVRCISAAVSHYKSGHFIFSCDESKECADAAEMLKSELPANWAIHVIKHKIKDDTSQNYKQEAQARIAQLQGSAFAFARKIKADICFSVESDVLIPPDGLRYLEWAMNCPNQRYDLTTLTYPNSSFLTGFGSYQHPIAEDFSAEERILKPRLKLLWLENKNRIKEFQDKEKELINQQAKKEEFVVLKKQIEKEIRRRVRLDKKIKESPPDGNIWSVISKHGWKRRGWLTNSHPALGKAIIEIDWSGTGALLMSKRALELATFHGYGPDCGSTQDLFLYWNRWHPAEIKAALCTHVLADHVKPELNKDKKRTGKYIHYISYHEREGEYKDHLRIQEKEWFPL